LFGEPAIGRWSRARDRGQARGAHPVKEYAIAATFVGPRGFCGYRSS
jgi:hypothetical protein